jgi:predicted transcriptional regulator
MTNKKEREDAFNQSCIDSYTHFKATGLHATHDEVAAWMDSWGTEKELPTPACHT